MSRMSCSRHRRSERKRLTGLAALTGALLFAAPPVAAAGEPGPLDTGRVQRFAGDGFEGGFSGDGRPAKYAQLEFPGGLAADAHGNVFIADTANARIRRVNAKGTIRTYAGGHGYDRDTGDGGLATRAGLRGPRGVAVDARGNVYVVGPGQNTDDDTRRAGHRPRGEDPDVRGNGHRRVLR